MDNYSHFEKQCSSCDKPSKYFRYIHVKDDEGGILPIVKGIEYMCEEHREQNYQDFKHGIAFLS